MQDTNQTPRNLDTLLQKKKKSSNN